MLDDTAKIMPSCLFYKGSGRKTLETLHLKLGPSRRLAAAITAMHIFACVMLGLAAPLLWLAVPLLVGSLAYVLHREILRLAPASIVAFTLHADCRCEFHTRSGAVREAALLGSSFVAPWLTVLNLKVTGSWLARHVVIVPDAVDSGIFRKLRVRLKWGCAQPDGAPESRVHAARRD